MKLKRVKILGFKTFADKTEFDVDGDIIAVVGPNGCGKSNIVDAVLWCLGETSARAIRAQTGKEVVFAGSAHRKPHSFAEVKLIFDNEDGALPIDTPEVSVTRRVDRGGQGEYEINSRACRLKDVADLLADSGLGRAGYAIVGQSEIDQALAASAQQRRVWVDEAAGVQRYRVRRQEAVRRLDAARTHLQRVRDVLNELDAQREPLAAEAEVAMRYRSAMKSLRQVECGLLVKELALVVRDLGDVEEQVSKAATLAAAETRLASEAEDAARHETAMSDALEAEAEALRHEFQAARELVEQTTSALQVARTKLESLDVLEKNLDAEAESSRERLAHAELDVEEARQELESETSLYQVIESELTGVGEEARRLKADLAAAEANLSVARGALAERQRQELEQLHRERRCAEVQKEVDGILSAIPELEEGIASAVETTNSLESMLQAESDEVAALDRQIAAIKSADEHEAEETRKKLSSLAALDGKRRGIEATIEAHEGLSQGAKAVLDLVKRGTLKGEYVPVGDCVQVEPDLALAIDTGLGAASNDLIVPDEGHAQRAIELLKDQCLGRATFQPVTRMRPVRPVADGKLWSKSAGVVGFAHELVECKPKYKPVLDSLLSQVIVVETLEDGLRLPRSSDWKRCVTLDGEVIHASGAVTGGKTVRQSTGLVQRQADLAETIHGIESLRQSLAQAEAESAERQAATSELFRSRAERSDTISALRTDLEEAKTWLQSLKGELTASQRSHQRLLTELEALSTDIQPTAPVTDTAEAEAARDEVWKRLAARNSDAESARSRLQEAQDRLIAAKRRLADAERKLESARQSDQHRLVRSGTLEPERDTLRQTIADAEHRLEAQVAGVASLQASLDGKLAQRRESSLRAQESTETAQRARKSASEAETMAHQHEIKRARLEGKRAVALERLLDEYGVSEAEAIALAPTTEVPPDSASLVARLRREIKDMGEVNLGAVEAFERLTERYDELNGQALDIESGMAEIETAVRELDRLTREKFSETFEKVRIAFAETFRRVFGGGEGVLSLVGGVTDLDSGVDIQVTVPGKKCQRLELLSGGERALSALAFLFALLRVKPSPLVILDEVDAPLDGRNVERFVGLMRDFCGETQFILVTHNPITIESADVWFGVTMQEPGVSTVVPFKVPDRAVVKAVVPDAYLKG